MAIETTFPISRRTVLLAALLALVIKLGFALATYGTSDVLLWEAFHARISAEGAIAVYREGARPLWDGPFNHPPFLINLIYLWGMLADVSGLPLRFWLRTTSSLADVGSVWLVWKMACHRFERPGLSFLLVAISPVSIMVAGFHGNTDPIMMFFLLLSIYAVESGRSPAVAGVALGMAMNIKIVPVLFAPVILLYLPDLRRRLEFVLGCAAIFVLGSTPYLFLDPFLIVRKVFGYSSIFGKWGFSLISVATGTEAVYAIFGKAVALGAVLAVTLLQRDKAASLFERSALVAFTFLFFAPGFGVQYLSWLVPWWPALPRRDAVIHYVTSSALLGGFYTVFSRGSWYLANAINPAWFKDDHFWLPRGQPVLLALRFLCWISVGMVALGMWEKRALNFRSAARPAVKRCERVSQVTM